MEVTPPLRLATRASLLAQTQSRQVADALEAATGRRVELLLVRTRGDLVQDRPLSQVGGKGLFTKEIEEALWAGEADLAVHSLKDLPTESPPGLVVAALPERVDARDALVGPSLDELPPGAVVGTGSARRSAQLLALRPDLQVRGIRGNVDTRLQKQRAGEFDAILLAMAGLVRLGRAAEAAPLDPERFVPAVGQGVLAVQARAEDRATLALLEAIHHAPTAACVEVERAFLEAIGGGCSVPAACHARWAGDSVTATAWFARGDEARRETLSADPLHARALGRELARRVSGRPA
jgi:hydroxymethylbilane synthase